MKEFAAVTSAQTYRAKYWIIVNKVDKKIRTKRKDFLDYPVVSHGLMYADGENYKIR